MRALGLTIFAMAGFVAALALAPAPSEAQPYW